MPARIVRLCLHLNMSVYHLYRYELHWLLIEERVIFKILWIQPSPQAHVTKKLHRLTEVRGPERVSHVLHYIESCTSLHLLRPSSF